MQVISKRDNVEEELERLQNMTEEEIYANALSDPDCQPIPDEQAARFVRLYRVSSKTLIERVRNARHGNLSSTLKDNGELVEKNLT